MSEAPLSPTSPKKSYLSNEQAIYAGLEDSEASEEDGHNAFLSTHLMNAQFNSTFNASSNMKKNPIETDDHSAESIDSERFRSISQIFNQLPQKRKNRLRDSKESKGSKKKGRAAVRSFQLQIPGFQSSAQAINASKMTTKNKTISVSGHYNHQKKFEGEREKMDNLMHIKQIYTEPKLPNSSQIVVAEHLSQVKAPTQAEMNKSTIKRNSALSFTSDQ